MADLDRFESDLAALIDMYRVQDHVGICTSDVARRLTEFLEIMKVCHEESRDIELSLVRGPYTVDSREVERTRVNPGSPARPVVEAVETLTPLED